MAVKGEITRVAIYSRKSKFTGKGESIGNQVELCREYVRGHFAGVRETDILVYEDEGFSGGNLERPGFKQMMKAARAHGFDAIVVYRLDRISRNISDFSTLIEELGRLGVAFISIREQFDTASPMGRAMMYIASVFSQLERETIAERIRDNMHELAKTGRWLGGITPTGYASESVKTVTVDGKTKKACKLKLVEEEARTVRLVYELFLRTRSLSSTEAGLMARGVRTKNGRQFSRFSIKAMLQNPVYLVADEAAYDYFLGLNADVFSERAAFDGSHGVMAYNRTEQSKGKPTVFLPVEEWIIAVGAHAGLIPSREWLEAQRLLGQNRCRAFRRPRSNEALLTGVLFCACGSRMYPKVSRRPDGRGGFQYTYVCKMKERSRKAMCSRGNVRGDALDHAVIIELQKLGEDRDVFLARLEESRRFYAGAREEAGCELAGLREEAARMDRKLAALVDSLSDVTENVARRQIGERIAALGREREALALRIGEQEKEEHRRELSEDALDGLCGQLGTFAASLNASDVVQRRAAVCMLVRRIVWDGDQAQVYLFGTEEDTEPDELLPTGTEESEPREISGHGSCVQEEGSASGKQTSDTKPGQKEKKRKEERFVKEK